MQLPFRHPRSGDVGDIAFADSRNGFLFGPALLVSHNGGESWRREALPPVQALGIGAGYAFVLTQRGTQGRVRLWRAGIGHDRWSPLSLPKDAAAPQTFSDTSSVQLAVEGRTALGKQRLRRPLADAHDPLQTGGRRRWRTSTGWHARN